MEKKMNRRILTLATLLLIGLLLSACSTDVAEPNTPDAPDEEVALRDVYSLTVGNGAVAQEMAKRGALMTGAVTPQSVSEIQADTENSLLYINADRAELEALKESGFLKDAVDSSVPVLIESAAAETLDSVTFDLFGFSVPGNALLISRYASGKYSATPVGGANDIGDVLDMALSRSTTFRDEPESAEPEAVQTPSEITTQQRDGFTWEGDPTAVVVRSDPKRPVYVWEGPYQECNIDAADDCTVGYNQSVSKSKTFSVSVGIDVGLGIDKASELAVSASSSFSRTTTKTWETELDTVITPGQFARPVIYMDHRYEDGWFRGTLSKLDCTSAPGGGTGCPTKDYREIDSQEAAAEYGIYWNGMMPASEPITKWEIEDTRP